MLRESEVANETAAVDTMMTADEEQDEATVKDLLALWTTLPPEV